jgi:Divergent InlB B-repeat domain
MGMKKMKRDNFKSVGCAVIICCAALLLFYSSAQAAGQEDGTSLLLEASPAQGGYLNIATGVHNYDMYAEVTLKATPKPGYQFVCWLGNVSNSATSSTSVFLNSPKMVIAVFEQAEFDTVEAAGDYSVGGGGDNGGGMVRGGGLPDSSLEEAVASTNHIPHYSLPKQTPPSDAPPVPTPEPATVTLFFAGFFMLVNRRKNGVNLTDKM